MKKFKTFTQMFKEAKNSPAFYGEGASFDISEQINGILKRKKKGYKYFADKLGLTVSDLKDRINYPMDYTLSDLNDIAFVLGYRLEISFKIFS